MPHWYKKMLADTPILPDDEAEKIEGFLSKKELGEVLFKMKNNKSPGSDGFSVEFFKFFWCDLGVFLTRSINYGYRIGTLSTTQREGIITCLPKGDKSKKYLKNWRPISLLNVVYKIASGAITKRIKSVLPLIINMDQTGFMADRSSSDSIRLVYDVLKYAYKNKKPGILLLIDFEKAFDSIAWSFLEKVVSFFNFGPMISKWIKLFITDIMSCVIVNGMPSSWFNLQ